MFLKPSKSASHATVIVASLAIVAAPLAFAAGYTLDGVTISSVAVNGGTDTNNPGTTCVKISAPVVAACPNGMVAIQNNNKLLIGAALQAKATSSKVWFYYDDAAGSFHCPGHVFTPCSVVSIEIK